MSETSQSVGRIAILTAFTLVFAAAWRGDRAVPTGMPATVTASKRESDSAADAGSKGSIVVGIRTIAPVVEAALVKAPITGRLLTKSTHRIDAPKPLFSGTPALLERSTASRTDSEPRTAAREMLGQAIQ